MRYFAALLLLVALPLHAALPAADSQGEQLPTLAPMLEKTVPGVVNIFTRTKVTVRQSPLLSDPFFRRFFNIPDQPRERTQQSLGSGVVVDADNGYILTNHHVIDGADEISVNTADGRTLQATVVGSDPETDIAVVKVEKDHLIALPMSNSDSLRVGDFVVAIGNPFGLGQTVTSGIVSALGRSGLGIEGYEDFIQTDASINPGNSGGALVNLRGELVGVNTAILSKSGGNVGIGFAIPINMAREIMAQLIEHGAVQRGTLGAQAQDLTPELATAFGIEETGQGAVVTQVSSGSPADKAGLRAGDVIVRINERPVKDAADVRNRIGLLRIGEKVQMQILRDGKPRTLRAVVEEPELVSIEGEQLHPRLAGAVLANVAEETVKGRVEGVAVADVAPGSPAMQAGLRKGDLIAQANRQSVTDLNSLKAAISGSDTLLLNIQRRGGALFLLLR
ncbi:MAG: DegQ family serine endoprotease [Gammaproteobacteria bacterium]|nr:DegQ family serine endoprotease [Gammaproteobacteria bacterium]MCW8959429.1 DegQ family serine endoprotease [Gammaproteobacteria bacterium]MCW8973123.1 DegQ family serine endoprotease [Gammaproteobacteria bacterium]MCW8993090.1 DegQ family serine endoprotease [Gammaproteobacteria bacterium]